MTSLSGNTRGQEGQHDWRCIVCMPLCEVIYQDALYVFGGYGGSGAPAIFRQRISGTRSLNGIQRAT